MLGHQPRGESGPATAKAGVHDCRRVAAHIAFVVVALVITDEEEGRLVSAVDRGGAAAVALGAVSGVNLEDD